MKSYTLAAHELSSSFGNGTLSPVEYVQEVLERIKNSGLNAFITVIEERSLARAREAERRVLRGLRLSPLDGVPVAVKDNIFIRGVRCTAGSKILSNFIPSFDSDVVKKLESAGAIIVGTTNMHEFASGVTSVNPHWGAVKNWHDQKRIAGGSSGGSAVAVSAGLVPLAVGTDTSGSVRIPASLCGVYGFKPTYGTVSLRGTFPLSQSLDHAGLFAHDAEDLRELLEVLMSKRGRRIGFRVKGGTKGHGFSNVKIANSYFTEILSDEVRTAFDKFIEKIGRLGIDVSEVEDGIFSKAREAWAPIRLAEATSVHLEWMNSRPSDYGADVLGMLRKGLTFSAVEYIRAKSLADQLKKDLLKVIGKNSVLVTPTCPITAPKIGETQVRIGNDLYDVYSVLSRNTILFNVTGFPALSIPAFLSARGLPMGMQIVASPGNDLRLIEFASELESRIGLNSTING